MTAWDDFRHAAKERGVLACELYVVISKSTAGPDETKATVPAHLAYQLEQEAAGTLAFAGPMSNLDGDGLGGVSLIIYRAASLEQARSLAENDPMHKNGIREFTLRKWLLNEGSFNLVCGFQKPEPRSFKRPGCRRARQEVERVIFR